MFHHILLVHSEKLSKKHLSTVEKVKMMVQDRLLRSISLREVSKEHLRGADLIITLGGDGTFIKSSSLITDNTPILGINSEPETSEGMLTSILDHELETLGLILRGKYTPLERERARIKYNGTFLPELALNEVYIGTDSQFHTSRYSLTWKGKKEEQRSSGVLVVTCSGSHAWYKSAGGIPFSATNKLSFLVREPYSGKRVFRPNLLQGEIHGEEVISIESRRLDGGILAIDALKTYPFNIGDHVEVSLSNNPLKVLTRAV